MWRRVAVWASLAVLWAGEASGDELVGASEEKHEVQVQVDGGVARYVVRRTLHNPLRREVVEAVWAARVPPGAAVVGLRVLDEQGWSDGQALGAEQARAAYMSGQGELRVAALLRQGAMSDVVSVWVGRLAAGQRVTVEYTLVAPTTYADGAHQLVYPLREHAHHAPVALRVDAATGARVVVDGASLKAGMTRELAQLAPWEPCMVYGLRAGSCLISDLEIPALPEGERLDFKIEVTGAKRLEMLTLEAPTGNSQDVLSGCKRPPHIDTWARAFAGRWRLVARAAEDEAGGQLSWSVYASSGRLLAQAPARALPAAGPYEGGYSRVEVSEQLEAPQVRVGAAPHEGHVWLSVMLPAALKGVGEQVAPASVVFVVDASRSMQERGVREQLRFVRAYMSHLPEARAQVVVARRGERSALFKGFLRASELDAALTRAERAGAFKLRNGDARRAAIQRAAAQLAARRGPRQLVLLGDDEPWPQGPPAWPEGVRVDWVSLQPDADVFGLRTHFADADRDDAALHWGFGLSSEASDEALRREAGELIWPTRMLRWELAGVEAEHDGALAGRWLEAGRGVWRLASAAVKGPLVFRARLGHTRWALPVQVDEASSRVAAALARHRARDGIAYVVPAAATRLAAAAPLLRRTGHAQRGGYQVSFPVDCIKLPTAEISTHSVVAEALKGIAASCGASPPRGVIFSVTTYRGELAHIKLTAGEDGRYAACVLKQAWEIALPPEINWELHSRGSFRL